MKTKRILIGCTVLVLAALACQLGSAPIISSQPVRRNPLNRLNQLNCRPFKFKLQIILPHSRTR